MRTSPPGQCYLSPVGPLHSALCREAEAGACQLELPASSVPSSRLLPLCPHPRPPQAVRVEITPPPWSDPSRPPLPSRALGCGVVNGSNQVVHWPLALGGGRNLNSGSHGWSLGSASLVGSALHCLAHLVGPVLLLPPPFSLSLFVPLPLAYSLKLACGTQGQTDYSFSSMNVPFN